MSRGWPDPLFTDPRERLVHVPRLRLDRYLAGDLPEKERADVDGHLAQCEPCQERVAAMRVQLEAAPLPAFDASRQRSVSTATLFRWRSLLVPLGALATALTIWFLIPGETGRIDLRMPGEETILVKGAPTLAIFVKTPRGEGVAYDGKRILGGGDGIKFSVLPAGYSYLLILSVDEARNVQAYYPLNASRSGRLSSRLRRQDLPGALTLDAARRNERLLAIFSRHPIETARVRSQVLAQLRQGRALGQLAPDLGDAVIVTLWVIKR